jgi:predicted  nucleic acid-binding Zn-ribbon protein
MVSQLYTVKTNQEYTALDMEIKNCKADINVKENELLNFALEIDKFMLELQEFENKVNFEEQSLK